MMRRRVVRVGALGALSAAFVVLLATPAFAHAVLLQTIPGEGAVLTTPPKTVTLPYNEQVEASLGAVRIYDSNGQRVDSGTISKPAPNTVQVAVPRLRAGAYVVTWRVISADSHPVQGSFTFQVGLAANATSPQVTGLATKLLHQQGGDTTLGAVYGVARGALFTGLALLLGTAAFGILVWPRARDLRRTRRLVGLGWGLTAGATVAGVVLQGPYGAGLTLGDAFQPDLIRQVLDTRYGQMALLRLALLLLAVRLLGRPADETVPDAEKLIEEALQAAGEQAIAGQDVTPFVLSFLQERSGGRALAVNRDLIVANAALAAEVAVAFSAS